MTNSMTRDGKYSVWYRTPRGQGTGIINLADGKISGGDSFFVYDGVFEVDGDRFSATLRTNRFADGPTTVLGRDAVELKLTGVFKQATAWCTGTSDQAPGVRFEATLFPCRDEAPAPDVSRGPGSFDAARLPREPDARRRAQAPLAFRNVVNRSTRPSRGSVN